MMKELSFNKMENLEGGGWQDCVLMVAGFAGAVASAMAGPAGIFFGALSFAGGVRSAQACDEGTLSRPTGLTLSPEMISISR
jgi:hypothetical protein